jgi:hypothetical protein
MSTVEEIEMVKLRKALDKESSCCWINTSRRGNGTPLRRMKQGGHPPKPAAAIERRSLTTVMMQR